MTPPARWSTRRHPPPGRGRVRRLVGVSFPERTIELVVRLNQGRRCRRTRTGCRRRYCCRDAHVPLPPGRSRRPGPRNASVDAPDGDRVHGRRRPPWRRAAFAGTRRTRPMPQAFRESSASRPDAMRRRTPWSAPCGPGDSACARGTGSAAGSAARTRPGSGIATHNRNVITRSNAAQVRRNAPYGARLHTKRAARRRPAG